MEEVEDEEVTTSSEGEDGEDEIDGWNDEELEKVGELIVCHSTHPS